MHCLFFLVRNRGLLSTGSMGRFFIRTALYLWPGHAISYVDVLLDDTFDSSRYSTASDLNPKERTSRRCFRALFSTSHMNDTRLSALRYGGWLDTCSKSRSRELFFSL